MKWDGWVLVVAASAMAVVGVRRRDWALTIGGALLIAGELLGDDGGGGGGDGDRPTKPIGSVGVGVRHENGDGRVDRRTVPAQPTPRFSPAWVEELKPEPET